MTDERYDEMLDELYPDITIGSCTFTASQVLKECDPIAYECGKSDLADAYDEDEDDEA